MFCGKCGNKNEEGMKFCGACGEPAAVAQVSQANGTSGKLDVFDLGGFAKFDATNEDKATVTIAARRLSTEPRSRTMGIDLKK